jgi:hypothetical protein
VAYGGRPPWQYVGLAVLVVLTAGLVAFAMRSETVPATDPGMASTPSPSLPGGAAPSGAAQCQGPERLAVLGDSLRREATSEGAYFGTLRRLLPSTGIRSFARDRDTLDAYVTDPVQQELDRWDPDAIELSLGVDVLRLDQGRRRVAQFANELSAYVDGLQVRFPAAAVVLTVPAALSTVDVGGLGLVRPPQAARQITRDLRAAYLEVAGDRPWVTLVDAQQEVTGTQADAESPPRHLLDQIQPDAETAAAIATLVADEIGCPV